MYEVCRFPYYYYQELLLLYSGLIVMTTHSASGTSRVVVCYWNLGINHIDALK